MESIHYADTVIDYIVQNEDPDLQKFTGYGQLNLMQKFLIRPRDGLDIEFGFHASTASNVPRYDRLTQTEQVQNVSGETEDRLRYAEWYYGPQNWFM